MAVSTPLKIIAVLVPAIAVFLAINQPGTWQLLNGIINQDIAGSEPQTYVLSDDPVVVYVKDFVSHQEAAHLANLA
jgi:prolyl 4-hydroxylase